MKREIHKYHHIGNTKLNRTNENNLLLLSRERTPNALQHTKTHTFTDTHTHTHTTIATSSHVYMARTFAHTSQFIHFGSVAMSVFRHYLPLLGFIFLRSIQTRIYSNSNCVCGFRFHPQFSVSVCFCIRVIRVHIHSIFFVISVFFGGVRDVLNMFTGIVTTFFFNVLTLNYG